MQPCGFTKIIEHHLHISGGGEVVLLMEMFLAFVTTGCGAVVTELQHYNTLYSPRTFIIINNIIISSSFRSPLIIDISPSKIPHTIIFFHTFTPSLL